MRYRRFGKTGLDVSVMTMGGMRFTQQDGPAVRAIMQAALDVGVNHFETARGYGESEKLMGWAFANGIDRSKVILTTKIGPQKTADDFMATLDKSMTALGVSYLDVLDVHGINDEESFALAMNERGNWLGVQRALDRKLIGHVGFSTHGPVEIIVKAIDTQAFATVNLHYYYFYQRNRAAVERAAELDMGVFIISPNDKGGMLFEPPAKLAKLCQPLSPMAFNNRWLLGQPAVHTLSVGMARPTDLAAHLESADKDGPLDASERAILDRLEGAWRSPPLDGDYCSQCYACLPCPADVLIPEVLRLRNLGVAMDMENYARYRYKMIGNIGPWYPGRPGSACTECGDCLPRCPEKLDIPRLLFDAHDRYAGEPGQRMWE